MMADTTLTNLFKFNSLVNPKNKKCYFTNKGKVDERFEKEMFTLDEALKIANNKEEELRLDMKQIDFYYIDVDNEPKIDLLFEKLSKEKIKYILLKSAREGNYHIYIRKPKKFQIYLPMDLKDFENCHIHDYYRSIPKAHIKLHMTPILPTPGINKRDFLKIPDKVDELPRWLCTDYRIKKDQAD